MSKNFAASKSSTIRILELPRPLVEELLVRHAKSMSAVATPQTFSTQKVPCRKVELARIDVNRIRSVSEDELSSAHDACSFPVAVIADGKLLAGVRAIKEAGRRGEKAIDVMDLTGLIDAQKTGYLADLAELDPKRATRRVIKPTETPQFKRWFGQSVVVDEDGEPLRLYHGTTGEFDAFDTIRLNVESDLGAGYYFTNSTEDASANYAGEGPDLKNRLQLLAERLVDSISDDPEAFDLDEDVVDDPEELEAAAMRIARERLTDNGGSIIPVYLSLQTPVQIGGSDPTWFEIETVEDDEGDVIDEQGTLIEFFDALRSVSTDDRFYDFDVERTIADIMEDGDGYDGITAEKLIQRAKKSEGLCYACDECHDGALARDEILPLAFEEMGFDGLIDYTVNRKFGTERPGGLPAMDGMDEETVHYVAFNPHQIKSAIGNSGAFDPESPSLTDAVDDLELKVEFAALSA